MSKVVKLTFSNAREEFSFDMIPENHILGDLWFNQLKLSAKNEVMVEKDCCWYGWPKQNEQFIIDELNEHLGIIQDYLLGLGVDFPIIQYSDMNKCLNTLHTYFENLQGVIWDQTQIFKDAPMNIKFAIRKTNTLTHQLEAIHSRTDDAYYPWFNVGFMQNYRIDIPQEALNLFDLNLEFGAAYLHYSQVGKTHYEVFVDDDELIDDGSIHGNRYITGEFDMAFYQWGGQYEHYRKGQFFSWCDANGLTRTENSIIVDGVHHPIGWAKVAALSTSLSQNQLVELLGTMDGLSMITISDGDETLQINCKYDNDCGRQIAALDCFMKGTEK